MNRPLAGIVVVDFSTLLPGPLASLMLAEAGARVIKIERPGGDDMRRFPPMAGGKSAAYAMLNRGKTILDVDLKSASGQAQVAALIAGADVLVEQFRPATMDRLGFGWERVRAINPRLIYCSLTGYGQDGPRASEAGHDLNYIGATGLLALQPGPSDRPTLPPALIADIGGGSFPAVINILLALMRRDRTGEGCRLDIAMTDAMFTFAWQALAYGLAGDGFPTAGGTIVTGASPRYQLYPTRDGRLVACAALEDKFWRAFCRAVDLPDEFADDNCDPGATRDAVAAIVGTRTAAEWQPILAAADCCATIVATLAEAVRDPQFVGRGLFARDSSGGKRSPVLPVPIAPLFREAIGADVPSREGEGDRMRGSDQR